ncbi:hypothetical protein D3C85_895160 [compost metagenome]
MQGLDRHADILQRLPKLWQLAQGFADLLLIAWLVDQLVERQVALKFFQVDQLIQTLTQGARSFEQLLLVGTLHQEELAGGLITGNPRDGLRFVGQLLWSADPLADVVFRFELQKSTDAKGNQQGQQDRCTQVFEQCFAAPQQKLGNPQRPLRRT